jgi:hypothetical protein
MINLGRIVEAVEGLAFMRVSVRSQKDKAMKLGERGEAASADLGVRSLESADRRGA